MDLCIVVGTYLAGCVGQRDKCPIPQPYVEHVPRGLSRSGCGCRERETVCEWRKSEDSTEEVVDGSIVGWSITIRPINGHLS